MDSHASGDGLTMFSSLLFKIVAGAYPHLPVDYQLFQSILSKVHV